MKLRLRKSKDLVVSKAGVAKRNQEPIVGPTPEMLIAQAIDQKVPIETMEKLLALMTRVKAERAREAYYTSLAQFQANCPIIKKLRPVYDKEEKGGELRYNFAPLNDIVEQVGDHLKNNGFSYDFKSKQTDTEYTAICIPHHILGHSESTEFTIPVDKEAYMSDPQKVGSACSFANRYAFRNAFGILTGDNDNDAQDLTSQEGQTEGQTVKYIQVDSFSVQSELKKEIEEELKSSVFNSDRAVWLDFMKEIKMTPGFKGMLKRVQRERKDREDAIKSEK